MAGGMLTLDRLGLQGTIWLTLVVSVLWGIWWIPIRWLNDLGLEGVWASLAMGALALPVLAVLALRDRVGAVTKPQALVGALLMGLAAMLYSAALGFTDVVRAVVIFYLAPAWSTAIECLVLGRRWNLRSVLALSLSFLGIATIFRFDISMAGVTWGDVAALAAGLAWAIGAALVFLRPGGRPAPLAFFAALGLVLGALGTLALAGSAAGSTPGPATWSAAPLAVAVGVIYLAPVLVLTIWAAQRLPPATMSFLLTAEIVAGVVTSAALLSEAFGLPELVGALLIIAGATIEALKPPVRRDAGAEPG
ncbi:MAG: DMT family transporter [Pararhodobacter sp.]|nr:DMT family transporter [Pararhodobacter sp.]